jgi:hypothetical protein
VRYEEWRNIGWAEFFEKLQFFDRFNRGEKSKSNQKVSSKLSAVSYRSRVFLLFT